MTGYTLTLFVLILFAIGNFSNGEEASTKLNEEVYDMIVVGLGPSGAAAFSKLARRGKRVLALEAAQRVGGRVHTVHVPDGVLELGAEWIHGQNNSRSYELATINNVTVKIQPVNRQTYRSDGSKVDETLMDEIVENCLDHERMNDVEPQSIGDFYTKQCLDYIANNKTELNQDKDFVAELLSFLDWGVSGEEASTHWNEVTTKSNFSDLYDAGEDTTTTSWHKHGYKTLFEILMNRYNPTMEKKPDEPNYVFIQDTLSRSTINTYNNGPGLPKNAELKLGKEVSRVEWAGPVALVRCADGSLYRARQVLVTVSLGVLKERHASLFAPNLPAEKTEAINTISMGVLDKIILTFDELWFPGNVTSYGFIWKKEDIMKLPEDEKWITNLMGGSRSMGSEHSLEIWANGEIAKHMETLSEEVVTKAAMKVLRQFLGKSVPEPKTVRRTTWYSNPLTRGSYSFDNLQTPQHPAAREQLGAPVLDSAGAPRLLFAGEATNPTHFAMVHGALETGIREANRMLGENTNSIY